MKDINGFAAIVTGGASGLGAATAEMLAEAGARVTLFDMNEEGGLAQAEKIGGKFIAAPVYSKSLRNPSRTSGLPPCRTFCRPTGKKSGIRRIRLF